MQLTQLVKLGLFGVLIQTASYNIVHRTLSTSAGVQKWIPACFSIPDTFYEARSYFGNDTGYLIEYALPLYPSAERPKVKAPRYELIGHGDRSKGEGVGIILNESEELSEKPPVYERFGEELRLTIFAHIAFGI